MSKQMWIISVTGSSRYSLPDSLQIRNCPLSK